MSNKLVDMELVDFFAALAMHALMLEPHPPKNMGELSKLAYVVAEAMIDEREGGANG